MAAGAGSSVTRANAGNGVGPGPPPRGASAGYGRRGLACPAELAPARLRGAGPRGREAGRGECGGGVVRGAGGHPGLACAPSPGAAAEIPALAPATTSGAEGGEEEGRACGDRVGLGTSSARPESSPLKGTFWSFRLCFTPASPISKLQESTSPLKKNTLGVRPSW